MPTYDYQCESCGCFDAVRRMADRQLPIACPDCGDEAQRIIVAAPRLAALSGQTRQAIQTNERAAHSPISSQEYVAWQGGAYARLRHPSGCGCCASSSRRGSSSTFGREALQTPPLAKSFPSKRPWMISH